jgi:hypothetical protein
MKKKHKRRRVTRAITDVSKSEPIPDLFKEPANSRGLHPPFTWYKLAQQVEEMDDLEKYGLGGCKPTRVRKQP